MPAIRSGSFVLYGFQLTDHGALLDGDTEYGGDPGTAGTWSWQNFNTVDIISFPTDVTFTGPLFLDTTTEGNGWSAGAPPPGFTLKTAPVFVGPTLHSVLTGCAGFGLLGTVRGAGMFNQCGSAAYTNADPLLTYIELLDFYQLHLTNTVGLTSGGINKTGPWSTPSAGIRITGGYEIIAWWWKLPDRTECGDLNTTGPEDSKSHLVLAEEQPPTPDDAFGEFEKLDPNDSDAAPQPVIRTLVPAGGRKGTRVQIIGEGFGDGANVQFDGVDALDIEVVSQYQILCTAPAHATGYANVAVINVDGVSS